MNNARDMEKRRLSSGGSREGVPEGALDTTPPPPVRTQRLSTHVLQAAAPETVE